MKPNENVFSIYISHSALIVLFRPWTAMVLCLSTFHVQYCFHQYIIAFLMRSRNISDQQGPGPWNLLGMNLTRMDPLHTVAFWATSLYIRASQLRNIFWPPDNFHCSEISVVCSQEVFLWYKCRMVNSICSKSYPLCILFSWGRVAKTHTIYFTSSVQYLLLTSFQTQIQKQPRTSIHYDNKNYWDNFKNCTRIWTRNDTYLSFS